MGAGSKLIKWCLARGIRLVARWIPGSEMPADEWSRELALMDRGDWEVRPETFRKICSTLSFHPTVDLMASRLNTKCDRFYSFRPDPSQGAIDFDALSDDKNWASELGYIAPPEHLVSKVLDKVKRDRARVLLLAPRWTECGWWNTLTNMTISWMTVPMTTDTVKVKTGQDPTTWPGKTAIAAVIQG